MTAAQDDGAPARTRAACDAVLFDLDGTLIDSAPDLAARPMTCARSTAWHRCRSTRCARWWARARAAWWARRSA